MELVIEQVVDSDRCPACGEGAQVKERPVVHYVDLPVYGTPMSLAWTKHRMRCVNPGCPKRTRVLEDHRIAAKHCLLTTRAAKWATRQVGGAARSQRWPTSWACDWHTVNDAVITYGEALLEADRKRMNRTRVLELQLPLEPGKTQMFRLTLEGGDLPAARDPRILNFRVFWCGWSKSADAIDVPHEPHDDMADESEFWEEPVGDAGLPNCSTPVFLHTNGCGDFTLMARQHWFDLRGYPEFDVFSMNLDSVLCYSAHHAGFREEILSEPMRIYHIEHQTGSGWTPEGQTQLYARLEAKGLPVIDYREVVDWAVQMRRLNSPMIFNRENWGLADLDLGKRFCLRIRCCPRPSGQSGLKAPGLQPAPAFICGHDFRRFAVHDQFAVIQPERSLAQLLDCAGGMRNEQQRLLLPFKLLDLCPCISPGTPGHQRRGLRR